MTDTTCEISLEKAVNPTSVWRTYLTDYKSYILMERSQSLNTLEAYLEDCNKFFNFMESSYPDINPQSTQLQHLQSFLHSIYQVQEKDEEERLLSISSQKRIVSGVRSFFKFLLITDEIATNPCTLLETGKLEARLPIVLSNEEIDRMLSVIDRSTYQGYRDALIIEVLYACGLRVSELLNLKTTDIFSRHEYIKVTGKGDKTRLVPIGETALKHLKTYINTHRSLITIKPNSKNFVFLSHRGSRLTRQYVFQMIKLTAQKAQITKNIHPHTLRHSFATELIKGGANLIAVRDMMGHQSVASTQVYTHLDVQHLRETIMLYHPHYKNKAWNKE